MPELIVKETYDDNDLVYVDPDARIVLGLVEWSRNGNPKALPVQAAPAADKEKGRRSFGRKHYPWGTYRSMKNVYRLEGKKRHDGEKSLDEVLPKALEMPFWD